MFVDFVLLVLGFVVMFVVLRVLLVFERGFCLFVVLIDAIVGIDACFDVCFLFCFEWIECFSY